MSGMVNDFASLTVRAGFLDDLSSALAFVTCDLTLGEHSRENLLFDEFDPGTVATCTCVNVAVGRSP